MKINIKALSLTIAIVWGGSILLIGLANLIWIGFRSWCMMIPKKR